MEEFKPVQFSDTQEQSIFFLQVVPDMCVLILHVLPLGFTNQKEYRYLQNYEKNYPSSKVDP